MDHVLQWGSLGFICFLFVFFSVNSGISPVLSQVCVSYALGAFLLVTVGTVSYSIGREYPVLHRLVLILSEYFVTTICPHWWS